MVVFRCVNKAYDSVPTLVDCSCSFEDTGFYLLLGESGSGKTTFLNVLSGVIPFDSGEIQVGGKPYCEQVDRKEIAGLVEYITQDSYFVLFLTVLDNLKLVSTDNALIQQLLIKYGLEHTSNQMASTLSGGERQRLALIRALLARKKILLLDEPTAALDEGNKLAVFSMLSDLKNEVLIICASHDRQAVAYADSVLNFYKQRLINCSYFPSCSGGSESDKAYASPKFDCVNNDIRLVPFLRKWFISKYRSNAASVLFTLFLTISLCLCIFSDFPENKERETLSHMYKINSLSLTVYGVQDISELLSDPSILSTVLEYAPSCPDGSENLSADVLVRPMPDYELTLYTLPFESDAFPLSSSLAYGRYFSEWNEIILSSEMAHTLNPDDPGSLIGSEYSVSVFGLGTVSFEIVGIFDEFSEAEKKYLHSLDIYIHPEETYNPDNYYNLYFVNSRLTQKLEDHSGFFSGNELRRCYRLYFRDYTDADLFFQANHRLENENIVLEDTSYYLGLTELFTIVFWVTLPLSVFMALFATLFYISLRRIEFMQNAQFIAVFEYAGFPRPKVMNSFIWLNVGKLFKQLLLATLTALLLTRVVNNVNNRLQIVNFSIFSFNYPMILTFAAFILLTATLFTFIMYRRIRVKSWYEILTENRDLI